MLLLLAGLSGDRFKFDGNGDGPARYNIIHFKQVSPGKYRWVKVGEYVEGELRLNMSGKWWLAGWLQSRSISSLVKFSATGSPRAEDIMK